MPASKRSKQCKFGDCSKRWDNFQSRLFSIASLFALAKEGNIEMLERISPTLNMNADALANEANL
jgi:hypothetical protein